MSDIYPIAVPKWGIEMVEGTITTWNKSEGDAIAKGDEVFEMESDKIVNVWDSPVDGILRRVLVPAGDAHPVGALLGVIAEASVADSDIDAFIAARRRTDLTLFSETLSSSFVVVFRLTQKHKNTKKKQGRYDDLKSAQENIDLQTTILSRFDLIFIVRDERLYERDLRIADHVLAIHAGAGDDGDDKTNPEREREQKFLKRYVEYCRAMCSPRLVPKSAKLLEDQYVRYRQEMRERAKKGGAPAVPITVRQLEAITRVSESLAKMCLQSKVSEEHVQEALRLFEVSTIDAARSGAAEMVVLTPEQREELALVETQIKQKLAIGATASKRHLAEDLARLGVNEWAVMRALMIMSQRGEIVERAEGRRVTRVH